MCKLWEGVCVSMWGKEVSNRDKVRQIFMKAYEEGKKRGMTDKEAVEYADMVLRRMGWWLGKDGEWYKSSGKKRTGVA